MKAVTDLKQTTKVLAAVVAGITFILYLPALRGELLLWDDTLYVINNPHIRSLDLRFFSWAFSDLSAGFWHPVTWTSYAVDYALWGLNPLGFHLTAVILHSINSYLVVILVTRLLAVAQETEAGPGTAAMSAGQRVLLVGGVTGILFGLHPLHVESVAWVSERKDLLCALFFIWSVLVYVNSVVAGKSDTITGTRNMPHYNSGYFLALALFFLALASKTMAVSLPIVLLILDYYPLARIKGRKDLAAAVTEKIPFFLLSLLSALISIIAQKKLGALASSDSLNLLERTLTACRALAMYLWKMAVPVKLIPFYPYPGRITLFSGEYLPCVMTVLAVSALCVVLVRQKRVLLAAWLYFLVTLLPVLGFVPIGSFSMADRFTYLPSIGPFMLAGLAAAWVWTRVNRAGTRVVIARRTTIVVVAIYLVLLSVLLSRQIMVWNNSVSLWSQVIEKGPYEIPIAYSVRGLAYLETGNHEQAIIDCTKALEIQPDYSPAYFNRGKAFMVTGRLDLAMADLDRAIAIDKKYADAHALRGQVHKAKGELAAAIADYTAAITISPELYEVYNYRGVAFKEMGEYSRAIEDYNRTLALLPKSEEAYNNRGVANRYLGRLDLAIADYSKAIAINPGFSLAYCNRGIANKELKNYDKAIEDFQQAKTLEPDLIKAYLELAECFRVKGRPDLARQEYEAACNRNSEEGCNALKVDGK